MGHSFFASQNVTRSFHCHPGVDGQPSHYKRGESCEGFVLWPGYTKSSHPAGACCGEKELSLCSSTQYTLERYLVNQHLRRLRGLRVSEGPCREGLRQHSVGSACYVMHHSGTTIYFSTFPTSHTVISVSTSSSSTFNNGPPHG